MKKQGKSRGLAFYWRRSGSQLVEFALVVPIFMIVLFGICQYALFFWGYITIRTASAIGARQAIISPGNVALITTAAKNAVNAPPLLDSNSPSLVVNVSPVTNAAGTLVTTIEVSYKFPVLIPYVLPPFTKATTNKTITATTIVQ
jgi:Flp pilus assembly protein TadG